MAYAWDNRVYWRLPQTRWSLALAFSAALGITVAQLAQNVSAVSPDIVLAVIHVIKLTTLLYLILHSLQLKEMSWLARCPLVYSMQGFALFCATVYEHWRLNTVFSQADNWLDHTQKWSLVYLLSVVGLTIVIKCAVVLSLLMCPVTLFEFANRGKGTIAEFTNESEQESLANRLLVIFL